MGNKMEIMGKDGIGMGNTQRLRSPVWVLLFSRSGIKQEKLDSTRPAKKCRKKDLTSSVEIGQCKVCFFTFERMSEVATFCPIQDARRCPKTIL